MDEDAVAEAVRASTAASGVPELVEDGPTLAALARLLVRET